MQNTFHDETLINPNKFSLSLTQKLISVYKLWHEFFPHFPKDSRYTPGNRIDSLFLETVEFIVGGSYLDRIEKLIYLKRASSKLDLLKFFLQVAWEIKSLDNRRYISISEKLDEAGRMLGGWIKAIK